MSVIFLESPYSGDIDRNIRYLALCGFDSSLLHGECPYASHGWMTQHPRAKNYFVSDYDHKWDVLTRDEAIKRSQLMRHKLDMTVFYTDLGWSRGMLAAKEYCQENKLPYVERTLDVTQLAEKCPFCTVDFCNAIIQKQDYLHFME